MERCQPTVHLGRPVRLLMGVLATLRLLNVLLVVLLGIVPRRSLEHGNGLLAEGGRHFASYGSLLRVLRPDCRHVLRLGAAG